MFSVLISNANNQFSGNISGRAFASEFLVPDECGLDIVSDTKA